MKAKSKTGTETVYIEPEVLPLPDMHMHTQSNNCCPLPLQWGVLAAQLPLLRFESDRKFLNTVASSDVTWPVTGRFGKVGQMSTDLALCTKESTDYRALRPGRNGHARLLSVRTIRRHYGKTEI
jgi:hypothetical protein